MSPSRPCQFGLTLFCRFVSGLHPVGVTRSSLSCVSYILNAYVRCWAQPFQSALLVAAFEFLDAGLACFWAVFFRCCAFSPWTWRYVGGTAGTRTAVFLSVIRLPVRVEPSV